MDGIGECEFVEFVKCGSGGDGGFGIEDFGGIRVCESPGGIGGIFAVDYISEIERGREGTGAGSLFIPGSP